MRALSLLVSFALVLSWTLSLTGCPYEPAPCFPTAAASLPDESEPAALERRSLGWEVDKLPALPDVPLNDPHAPPSEVFVHAERDMKTEFWLEAAKELITVVRGDTSDGRRIRQVAEFDLAIALFRLRYYGEARHVFRLVAADPKHPMQNDAAEWMKRQACSGG
jgi:hypothetical protein